MSIPSSGLVVSALALAAERQDPTLVLLDARSGPDRRERFLASRLRGARFVDLDADLARIGDPARGGRHPLPPPTDFAATLGRLGVGPASRVVVYDDRDGANAAARAWWMLRAIGHRDVAVLDGGLAAAREAGLALESGPAGLTPDAPPYPARAYGWPLVTIDEVDARRLEPGTRILDARDARRFRGEVEPFDPVAGHVPGAISAPYAEGLDERGRMRSPEALRERFAALLGGVPPSRVIVHCGSGVTACHTLLQLELAGVGGAALWVGSWSEWCRQDRPVGRGP